MNKTERLQAILTALQSKRVVTAEALATRFDVSVRTVYRDIRSLEEAGIPIGAEAGIGYFITDGYYIPPVMFSQEEAMALLVAGKFISVRTDKRVNKAFESAVTKIKSVLDQQKKEQWEDLEDQILMNPFDENNAARDLSLDVFKKALAESTVVEISYKSASSEDPVTRRLEPIGLTYYYQEWHLIAWCRLRNDYRDFRLDRVMSVSLISERFKKHKHPSLREYLAKTLFENDLKEVVVQIKNETMKFIEKSKFAMGMVSEKDIADSKELTFAVHSIDYFARWVMTMGNTAKVVSPESLKERVKGLADGISLLYEK